MDAEQLSKRYMEKYNELSSKFEESDINALVEDLNDAVSKSDMESVNVLYNKVLDWNAKVENLIGARLALHAQFHYLRLPSPALFGIMFDNEDKLWRFNTI